MGFPEGARRFFRLYFRGHNKYLTVYGTSPVCRHHFQELPVPCFHRTSSSMMSGGMFTSQGYLLVLFIEADAGPSYSKSQNNSKEQPRFFARVSLIDADNASHTLQNFTTSFHTDMIGEEFLFQRVSSSQNLVISLHYLTYDGSDSDRYHSAVIPVSRLAENVEISQWYQLLRHGTTDEPGSSVRLQIKYYTRDSEHFTTSTTIGRTLGNRKAGLALAAREGRSSLTTATNSNLGSTSMADKVVIPNSNLAVMDLTMTTRKSIEEKSVEGTDRDRNRDNDDYPSLQPTESRNSTTAMNGTDVGPAAAMIVASPQQRTDERLVVGIIDYALLFGPMHMNETIEQFPRASGASTGNSDPSSTPSLSAPMLSTQSLPLPSLHDSASSPHVLLWDRFPIDDHEDSPLPPKIEVS